MITSKPFADRVKPLLSFGPRGIVDSVDDLVLLSGEMALSLEWNDERCWIRPSHDLHDSIELPWRKGVFRAALARLHVLCNERVPNSVGPYGGSGELTVPGVTPTATRVVFVNTTGELRVELTPVRASTTAPPAVVPTSADIRDSVRPVV